MDDRRFDEWTRGLTGGGSRRRLVGGLAGGVGAWLLALLDPRSGEARAPCFIAGRRCRRNDQCCGGHCAHGFCRRCAKREIECKRECLPRQRLDRDPRNCGACGRRCRSNERCERGRCVRRERPCRRVDEPCQRGGQCCSGNCDGVCLPRCREEDETCDEGRPCCEGLTCDGICFPLVS